MSPPEEARLPWSNRGRDIVRNKRGLPACRLAAAFSVAQTNGDRLRSAGPTFFGESGWKNFMRAISGQEIKMA